jgi:hypothetical protein
MIDAARRSCLFTMLLVGCGSSDPSPPTHVEPPPSVAPREAPSAPAPSVEAPSPPPTIAPSPVRPTHQAPPALDATQRATARDAVREGRVAVHASRFRDALAAFQRALAIDTRNARLQCEAGYVAYLAGDHVTATTLIAAALSGMPDVDDVTAELRVPYAQCLYNSGLVYEAAGENADARDAYERSLALRENRVVQVHLDGLPQEGAQEHPLVLTAEMTDAEIGEALELHHACVQPDDDWPLPELGDVLPLDVAPGVETQGVTATMFWFSALACDLLDAILVVRAEGRVDSLHLLEMTIGGYGSGNNYEEGDVVTSSLRDLVPGGLPEIVVTTRRDAYDDGDDGCVHFDDHYESTFVCSLEGGMSCVGIPTLHTSSVRCSSECFEAIGDERGCPPSAGHVTTSLSASVAFDAGQITVTVTNDDDHQIPARLVGTHDIVAATHPTR